jgi:hypothetical protein
LIKFHPIAERLLDKCDAVLRVGGASQGTDLMIEVARKKGLQVFYGLEEITLWSSRLPKCSKQRVGVNYE